MAILRALVLVSSIAVSLALSIPRSLPSGTVTCGSNKYSVSELTAAIDAGLDDLDSGNLQGSIVVTLKSFWCFRTYQAYVQMITLTSTMTRHQKISRSGAVVMDLGTRYAISHLPLA